MRPLLILFLSLSLPVAAQSPAQPTEVKARRPEASKLRLTLHDALRMAIEHNLAIRVDAFGPDIAKTRIQEELGVFDPEIRSGYTHRMSRDGFGSERHAGSFDLGIGGRTPLGSTYDFRLDTTSDEYRSYRSGLGMEINQPLLRGFGTDVNLAGLRIARIHEESSQWAFRQQVINVVTQTHYIYNELYAAHRQHDAAIRSRDAARQLEADERQRASLGVRIALDVTTARAEAAAREEAVLLARQRIADYERYLKQLISNDLDLLLHAPVSIAPPPTTYVGRTNLQQGLQDALKQRPDYQQALLELGVRKINIVTTRNATLPRLDLNASLSLLGVSRSDLLGSYRFYDDENRQPGAWSAGVIFRQPIPNRSARGRHHAARLLQAQSLIELQRLEQSILVEVANAAGQIDTGRQRIETNRESLRLAQESLVAGEERLKAGSATTFEVLELQRKVTHAEAALIKAESDYRNAIAEYDRQTGSTLSRNRITIQSRTE